MEGNRRGGKPEGRETGGEGKRRGRTTQVKGDENQFASSHSHELRDSFLKPFFYRNRSKICWVWRM